MKGIDERQIAILLPQIQDRFGSVSEIVRQRLLSMSAKQRAQIATGLLRANSLRDLGLE